MSMCRELHDKDAMGLHDAPENSTGFVQYNNSDYFLNGNKGIRYEVKYTQRHINCEADNPHVFFLSPTIV